MEASKTAAILEQFNTTIDQWTEWLHDYSLAMLLQQPQPGAWSLGQLYTHITDDTNYFVEQVSACLQTTDNSEKDMHEHARAMFSNNQFPDRLLQGPSANTFMAQPASKEALRQRLLSIKDAVNKLCTEFNMEQSTGKTQHPGLQFFTAAEWLQFAEMHMRHHYRQKKRIDAVLFLPRGE